MSSFLRLALAVGIVSACAYTAVSQTTVTQHLMLVDPTTGHMIKLEVPALTGPFTVIMPSSAGTLMTTTSGWALGGNNLGSPGPLDNQIGTKSNHNLIVIAGNDQKMSFSSTAADPITILDGTGLALQESGGSDVSTFKAGTQAASINYTLPTTQPAANNILTASSVSGSGPYDVTLSWAPAATYKEMTAAENNASTTVYEQLGELDISVVANTTYLVDVYLFNDMTVTEDSDVQFTFPTGTTFSAGTNVGNQGPSVYNSASPATFTDVNTRAQDNVLKVHGLLKVGTTAGTLSTFVKVRTGGAATTLTINPGSHIILRKL